MNDYQAKMEIIDNKIEKLQNTKLSLKTTRFSKKGHIVTDWETDLEWYLHPDIDTTWNKANSLTKDLGDNWRMPTLDELHSLYEQGVGLRNIDPIFKMTGWWVWSDEKNVSSYAKALYFAGGRENLNRRVCSNGYRCFAVRPKS